MMAVALVTSAVGTTTAQAKAKKTTYQIRECMITKFSKSGNKLVVKVAKATKNEKLYINDKPSSKRNFTFTLSKNCKWYDDYFVRASGKTERSKMTYKMVKTNVKYFRKQYVTDKKNFLLTDNGAYTSIIFTVKNGKVTMIRQWNM
jgi:hypothetical protein